MPAGWNRSATSCVRDPPFFWCCIVFGAPWSSSTFDRRKLLFKCCPEMTRSLRALKCLLRNACFEMFASKCLLQNTCFKMLAEAERSNSKDEAWIERCSKDKSATCSWALFWFHSSLAFCRSSCDSLRHADAQMDLVIVVQRPSQWSQLESN